MYDYYLGGENHYPADRELADKVLASMSAARTAARENRAFMGRAVRFLAEEIGLRQFLDIGTGLPTSNSVHEVAQAVAPSAWVVYADNDRCKSGCAHATPRRQLREANGARGGVAQRHFGDRVVSHRD